MPGESDPDKPGVSYSVSLGGGNYPATISAVAFGPTGTSTTIVFDFYGKPDAPGSVTLRSSGATRTIQIDAVGSVQ